MTAEGAYLYTVRCRDESLYIGTTRDTLETRIAQHNAGTFGGHTSTRKPVTLAYSEWFANIAHAIAAERKLKKRTRAKKEAFIRKDFGALRELSKRGGPHPSRRGFAAPQDEGNFWLAT